MFGEILNTLVALDVAKLTTSLSLFLCIWFTSFYSHTLYSFSIAAIFDIILAYCLEGYREVTKER